MLRRLIGEHIELIWRPSSHVGTIKIDPIQIDQLLTNLCVNARDAIPDTGTITIETDSRTIDEDYCITHADYLPGDYVMLAVSDTGVGMTRNQMNNVFEPFFTTKPLGEGTGLGLSTVYGIVKQNDGFINVYSEPGEGTTFKIYLPLLATSAENDQAKGPNRATLQAAGETILVVEDDPAILRLTGKLLQDLGYRPLLADSVETALELAAAAESLELLLTDVVMPRMNGAELAASIDALRPGIKVIFMSGYTADVIAHKGVLNDDVTYIQKPFSRNGLAVTLKKALTDA
jgi:CheY-like chemotaxis protein